MASRNPAAIRRRCDQALGSTKARRWVFQSRDQSNKFPRGIWHLLSGPFLFAGFQKIIHERSRAKEGESEVVVGWFVQGVRNAAFVPMEKTLRH